MNRSIAKGCTRDLSSVYYDVTNYYFEIDTEDSLRRRGVSKEHRKSPIVQMGLLQDGRGIPIAYRIFPGNTSDSKTMIPTLQDLKCDYGLERVVTVADKGLNCSENIAATLATKDGFVFSQSLRATKSDNELKAWVLDEAGYTARSDFKMKSKQGVKTIHLKAQDTADNTAKDVVVEVKYVAFWSRKYAERARRERARVIEKAKALIANPGAYTRATSFGAAKYVRGLHFDTATGEIADARALALDTKAIAQAEALDGYYLIVTSETSWSAEQIIDTYRELWRIEESFKITKSELVARPVYVWTPAHIEAHFLTCYIALVILRLLQWASGLTCARIREEIAQMNCVNIDANWWVCTHRSDDSDKLVETVGLEELKLKNLRTKDAKAIMAKAAKAKLPHKK
ncbi:IS1634 family transposase [Collinsella sp. AGMB00827]|uniref:IS1634 family transposase n=1 Tax=Collinsella ureilytica TaxID=2869515 RepID=A0ABS7MKR9_9ACTN|nr:IS1634 family transposase [Collinsella urealyticum]MBY4797676.1 IS1634 family transposase [Collinsella urealyticum]